MTNVEIPIRPETLRPYLDWQPPRTDEIREVVRRAGSLTGSEICDYVGLPRRTPDGKPAHGTRTVRKWLGGQVPIPYSVWCLLCDKAGFEPFWRA